MSYRFLIVNTDYSHFLDEMYHNNPGLGTKSFDEQYSLRMQTLFGVNDFYSTNLHKLGHEAVDLIYNNRYMQYAWAKESGLVTKEGGSDDFVTNLPAEWLATIFKSQVRLYKPDILINLAMDTIGSDILKGIKQDVRMIIGQHASPITAVMDDLSAYDLLLSSLPHYVDYFRKQGKPSLYLKLGFGSTILDIIAPKENRPVDIGFVGGFLTHHSGGAELFNYLAQEGFSMVLYGYGEDLLSPKAKSLFQGGLYGKDMYELYSKSKIVINRHISISGEYANNMRLYEATGMGALLITDWKKNLGELFDVGNEVVAYRSKEECADLVRYYLKNDGERQRIAANGQKRIVSGHTYYHRMSELLKMVERYLGSTKTLHKGSPVSPGVPDTSKIEVSIDSLKELKKLKIVAEKSRFGNWLVKFNGQRIYCHDLLAFYIAAKDIFLHRIYDFESKTDSPVVIDGGGHIGLFTLFVKRKYPNAKITVFEPDKESLRLLRKNLEANLIDNVKIVEAGLYKNNGEISFGADHSDGGSIYSKEKNATINVVRLSEYIECDIDFLKLNIEGAELDVMTEAAYKLQRVKEMVIEYHGFPEVGQNLHKLLTILEKAGFRYIIHDFDAETNPATKPPFRLSEQTRFFLLIHAKKLFPPTKSQTGVNNFTDKNTSLQPISRLFGFDRGTPIDRCYIENFLKKNASCICGHVLEIAGNEYTKKYGTAVTQSDVLNSVASPQATIIGDLASGENIPESAFDCIILTQTIQYIYDVKAALRNAVKALKPGGTLLITTSGISQISRYDMDRWGEYWRFTDKSLKMLLAEIVPEEAIDVQAYGNVAVAKAFLDGRAVHELDQQVLDYQDDDYQVLLTARVCKPASNITASTITSSDKMRTKNVLKSPLVLLYHRVANDPIDSQLLAVSPENFEAHLSILAENYRVIPLHQLLEEICRNELKPDTVALTFDDGYLDNLTNAVPLLEKYGLHATIFITSGMLGSDREFWWDELERIFLTGTPLPDVLVISNPPGTLTWDLASPRNRLKAYDELCVMLRVNPVAQTEAIVDRLLAWAGLARLGRTTHRILSCEQLRQLTASPAIEIGSHTLSHTRLSVLSSEQQRQEIRESKQKLEALIKGPVRMFSYPYGTTGDFSKQTAQIVAEEGYDAGIANIQGNITAPLDMYAVPRRLVRNWPEKVFASWLKNEDKSRLEQETISARADRLINYLLSPWSKEKQTVQPQNK